MAGLVLELEHREARGGGVGGCDPSRQRSQSGETSTAPTEMSHRARHQPPVPTPLPDDRLARPVDVRLHRQHADDEGLQLVVVDVRVVLADLQPLHPRPLRRRATPTVEVTVHERLELGPGDGAGGFDDGVVDEKARDDVAEVVGAGAVDALRLDREVAGPVVSLETVEKALKLGAEDLKLDGSVSRKGRTGDGVDEMLHDGLRG